MDSVQFIKDVVLSLKHELVRFRAGVAILFSVIFLAVLMVSLKWPKVYTSDSVIVMDVTNVIEPLLRGAAEMADLDKSQKVQDVLQSRRLLERVLRRIDPTAVTLDPDELEWAIAKLRRGMTVTTQQKNRQLTYVSYTASDPEAAYDTLTAVVNLFIEDRMAEKQKQSYDAHSFISDQVVKYKQRLEQAEARLKEFKSRSIDATEQGVSDRISELTAEIQNLKMTIDESEEKIVTTRRQLHQESQNLELRTKLQSLQERRDILADELDRLRLIYQDSYPDVVTAKNQLFEIDQTIAELRLGRNWGSSQTSELPLYEELRKQLSAAEVEAKTQKSRLRALTQLLEQERERSDTVAENQAELMDLNRDYNVTKKVYEEMLARKENANLTLALNEEGQGETYRILEPPRYPLRPSGVPAIGVFLAAPVLAFAAPLGLIVLFVLYDPRIRSSSALAQKLPAGVSLLGYVPHRGSRLTNRLLRKDIILLVLLAIILLGVYVYTFITFRPVLL